ncbi:hypothetical protein JW960_27040 [candidate division KSB1 bacterium]|nr:hypothetical protein [candidate division KSB1 bacterium]
MPYRLKKLVLLRIVLYFGSRYYDPSIGRWYVPDPQNQMWTPYGYCGNSPVMYIDENGEWFGIDDLIISGVSFVVGYVQYGVSTGDWGGDALAAGGIAAGSAWLAYNTGGMAAGWLFEGGSTGFALTASTVGGAVGGFSNSIGMQAYFNHGNIDMNQAWSAAGYGAIGGFAGGTAGLYISDPIAPGMIGGAVSGGIEGSTRGDWVNGAFMGAWWGGVDASLTTMSYEAYGRYLANKTIKEGAYGSNYVAEDGSVQSCRDFASTVDDYFQGDTDLALFGEMPNSRQAAHEGVALGRNKYGQHYVISKEGIGGGIFVRTSTYYKNMYGSPFKIFHIPSHKNIPNF